MTCEIGAFLQIQIISTGDFLLHQSGNRRA